MGILIGYTGYLAIKCPCEKFLCCSKNEFFTASLGILGLGILFNSIG